MAIERDPGADIDFRDSGYARSLIEASLDPLVTIGVDGRIMDVNAATVQVTGQARQALIGSDFSDYFTDPERARAGYLQAFDQGQVTDYPLAIRHVSDALTEVLYNAAVYRHADGEVAGVFAAARDVTEQRRISDALALSEERFRLVAENTEGVVLLVSLSGEVTWASPSVERTLGYTADEALTMTGASLVHPDDLSLAQALWASPPGGEAVEREVRVRRKDGQYRWMLASARWATDPSGAVVGRVDTLRDVHKAVLARQEIARSEHTLRTAMNAAPQGMAFVGLDGRFMGANEALRHLLGRSQEWLDGHWVSDLFTAAGLERDLGIRARLLSGDAEFDIHDCELVTASGAARPIMHSIGLVRGEDGQPLFYVSQYHDVTEERRTQASLVEAQRMAHVGSWRMDVASGRVVWTLELYRMLGLDPGQPPPDYEEHGKLFAPESWARLSTSLAHTQETGEPYELELEIVRPDGTRGWMLVRGEAVRGPSGAIVALQGVALDITGRKRDEAALRQLATHDSLTGLPNRFELLGEIKRALHVSRRETSITAVLMVDLDRFKNINDTLGHSAGDEVLQAAAQRITDCVRGGDLVARPGGDEFVIVLRDLADPQAARSVAERILDAFRVPFKHHDAELVTTASIGIAFSDAASEEDDLVREADIAMYAAKEGGRDRTVEFSEGMRAIVESRMIAEVELRHALERGELDVWYQPEVDLGTGSVVAVEALLRWHHPDGGVRSASTFIEVAEETGLILGMGDWVMRTAFAQAATWAKELPDRHLTTRINLSALQLSESTLLATLDELLASGGLDPARLCFEITETVLLAGSSTVRENLAGIHERGFCVAIDDFGTAYASLASLRDHHVDVIKIDRSFISSLTVDPHDRLLVASILAMGLTLGIDVVAEGVERDDQASALRGMRCRTAQGFLYSQAVPASEIPALLDTCFAIAAG